MFSKYNMTYDTFLLDNEALRKYLEVDLNKIIPEKYKTNQGRIVKEKKVVPPDSDTSSNTYLKYLREITLLLLFLMF